MTITSGYILILCRTSYLSSKNGMFLKILGWSCSAIRPSKCSCTPYLLCQFLFFLAGEGSSPPVSSELSFRCDVPPPPVAALPRTAARQHPLSRRPSAAIPGRASRAVVPKGGGLPRGPPPGEGSGWLGEEWGMCRGREPFKMKTKKTKYASALCKQQGTVHSTEIFTPVNFILVGCYPPRFKSYRATLLHFKVFQHLTKSTCSFQDSFLFLSRNFLIKMSSLPTSAVWYWEQRRCWLSHAIHLGGGFPD